EETPDSPVLPAWRVRARLATSTTWSRYHPQSVPSPRQCPRHLRQVPSPAYGENLARLGCAASPEEGGKSTVISSQSAVASTQWPLVPRSASRNDSVG